jgi:Xaa-Pro aminopeptidase
MPPKDTTKLLLKLRSLMKDTQLFNGKKLDAYIIPSSDAHGSEYLSEKDKRREFISGFSGSSGTALVTNVPTETALLWTDGRYYLQASNQLDSNWTLMKDGLADTPSISDWLISNLSKDSNRVVGIDARLYEEDLFIGLYTKLNSNKIDLIHVDKNLIDLVWEEYGKPNFVERPIIKLNTKHTGKRSNEKLKDIRDQMIKLNANSYVITSLDEIAWLLNLRGQDIPFGAVFFSYCLVTLDGVKLFTNTKRLDGKCMLENNVESTIRSYLLGEDDKFEFYEYDEFYNYFYKFVQNEYVKKEGKNNENNNKKIYLSSQSNHAIHSWVPLDSIHKDMSIIAKAKIIKNHEEIEAAKSMNFFQ